MWAGAVRMGEDGRVAQVATVDGALGQGRHAPACSQQYRGTVPRKQAVFQAGENKARNCSRTERGRLGSVRADTHISPSTADAIVTPVLKREP